MVYTEIVCIIDKSGSMDNIKSDAIGGFNTFIEEQKKVEGTASVTLVLFDHTYQVVYENKDINNVELLTDKTYIPGGMTALLDAIGRTIDDIGKRLANTEEDKRPDKVMICILTDGEENSSNDYTRDKIKGMITHQREKYNWGFAFLGANQDSFKEGNKIGITKDCIANFAYTGEGVKSGYTRMSHITKSYRSTI